MTVVVDASCVVAALVDDGPVGRWAEAHVLSGALAAPHVMPAEVSNVLRKAAGAGLLSSDVASLAHRDLDALPIQLLAYSPFADRVWELRSNLTAYDAWYVALAESLDAPLATLDHRLSRAPGVRCRVVTPAD